MPLEARVNREVIVSCGSVQSPGVLEHSGIGQPELLRRHGIEVRHELKGVGENYGDHFAPRMNWRVKLPITLNEQTRGLSLVKEVIKYYSTGRGALALTAGVVYGFVRTRPGLESPDMQFHMAHASYDTAQKRLLEKEPGMTVVIGQCRPDSRGSIHIKSATPGVEPAIRPNFLSAQTRPRRHGRGHADRPQDRARTPRWRSTSPTRTSRARTCNTYDEWLDFARHTGQTTYHVVGTCKMGSDPMAVVDDRLRVHGIAGPAGHRRLDHADRALGQHQRPHDHGCREGRRHDQRGCQGGTEGGRLTREIPVKPFMSFVAVVGLAIGLSACTTGSNPLSLDYKPESKENLLADFGLQDAAAEDAGADRVVQEPAGPPALADDLQGQVGLDLS